MKRISLVPLACGLAVAASACGDGSTPPVIGAPVAVAPAPPLPPVAAPVGDTVPINARVRDAVNQGVAGVDVEFEVREGGGMVFPEGADPSAQAVVVTDADGLAMVGWIMGSAGADQQLRVRALGADGSSISQFNVEITALGTP